MICKTKIVKTNATENKMHKNRISAFLVHLLNCDLLDPVFKNISLNRYNLKYKNIDKYKEVLVYLSPSTDHIRKKSNLVK